METDFCLESLFKETVVDDYQTMKKERDEAVAALEKERKKREAEKQKMQRKSVKKARRRRHKQKDDAKGKLKTKDDQINHLLEEVHTKQTEVEQLQTSSAALNTELDKAVAEKAQLQANLVSTASNVQVLEAQLLEKKDAEAKKKKERRHGQKRKLSEEELSPEEASPEELMAKALGKLKSAAQGQLHDLKRNFCQRLMEKQTGSSQVIQGLLQQRVLQLQTKLKQKESECDGLWKESVDGNEDRPKTHLPRALLWSLKGQMTEKLGDLEKKSVEGVEEQFEAKLRAETLEVKCEEPVKELFHQSQQLAKKLEQLRHVAAKLS